MASPASDSIVVDETTLALLQGESGAYTVLGARLENEEDAGNVLFDVIEADWSPNGRPGLFTSRVRWSREWDTELAAQIAFDFSVVEQLYRL